ncbi:helix-turn-helix transcriptional regulator [Nocardioides dongkuii]|uniref:helix-turn-helix transcriptional regulator n=1 Tax=Nocardioides dongkuii TaxID=2760089 RepID=UPI001878F558|nr:WYL domain-containing protein [Nocardioides dongkuii]
MSVDVSPTARALLALELLQNSPGITAERLGRRLGVTARAARRYVEILREADIPVESVRGPAGGYRLGRGVRPPPLLFTAPEALGLVMAALDGHHDAADPADPVGSALGKLLGVLPRPVAAQAEALRRTAAPVPDRGASRPDPATTVALVEACAGRRRVRLGYRTGSGSERDLEAEPWALVVRYGRWYLLCRSVAANAVRTYRVDRVTSVHVLETGFEPPADLDPVASLEENLAVGWEHDVAVIVDAPLDRVAPCVPRTLGRLEPAGPDATRLVGSTDNPAWYAEQVAGLPAPFRVEGGPELRAAVEALGHRLLASVGISQA